MAKVQQTRNALCCPRRAC